MWVSNAKVKKLEKYVICKEIPITKSFESFWFLFKNFRV